RLLVTGGEERTQPEQVMGGARDTRQHSFAQTEAFEQLGALFRHQLRGFGFELHTHTENLGSITQVIAHRSQDGVVADLVLVEVHDGEHRLDREEEERLEAFSTFLVQPGPVQRCPLGQQGYRPLQRRQLRGGIRLGLRALHGLASPVDLRLGTGEVGEGELELERVQIVERIVTTDDVLVVERPQHVEDRVDLADAPEEPVAQTLAPLDRIVYLLDRQRAPAQKAKAFARARDLVQEMDPDELRRLHAEGRLQELPGIGESTGRAIAEALEGEVPAYLAKLEGTSDI